MILTPGLIFESPITTTGLLNLAATFSALPLQSVSMPLKVVSFRITKCLLMQVNIQVSSNILDCSDRNNSKYYVVVYSARFNADDAVKNFLYSLNEGKIPKKRFNRQLAPEETSIKLLFPL
ncbi:hypothetical protein HID58_001884 [Brassica napus]|uniref:Uncharacterized protein n=1 Tax=Brassica napus TaxID=3708 RepID=A0ABQ8ELS3_BRANA|nr:hypothetical protein HID58_001884 [Brassica napus]